MNSVLIATIALPLVFCAPNARLAFGVSAADPEPPESPANAAEKVEGHREGEALWAERENGKDGWGKPEEMEELIDGRYTKKAWEINGYGAYSCETCYQAQREFAEILGESTGERDSHRMEGRVEVMEEKYPLRATCQERPNHP